MRTLCAVCTIGLGLMLTLPLVLLVFLALSMLYALNSSPSVGTWQFNPVDFGAFTINGATAVPGWATQLVSLVLAITGFLLMRHGVHIMRRGDSSEGS